MVCTRVLKYLLVSSHPVWFHSSQMSRAGKPIGRKWTSGRAWGGENGGSANGSKASGMRSSGESAHQAGVCIPPASVFCMASPKEDINPCPAFQGSCEESVQFSHSVVSSSVTPWTAACQASLSITTGDGNGKPLQYSCLQNPMNSVRN